MRRFVSVGALAAMMLTGGMTAARQGQADEPAAPPREGLRIDIGRFTPSGRGIVIDIGKRPHGGVHVDVQTHSPTGGRGIHVNVEPEAIRHGQAPAVEVQVQKQPFDGAAEAELPEPGGESYLGVFTDPVPQALAEQLGDLLPNGQGLLVADVLPDSPAVKAGLKRHDVLTAYQGEVLSSPDDLKQSVVQDPPGTRVELTVIRGARVRTMEAVLGERAAAPADAPLPAPVLGESSHDLGPALPSEQPIERQAERRESPLPPAPTGDEAAEVVAPPPQADASPVIAERSVHVTSPDGRFFRLEIRYVDRVGRPQQLLFEGTKSEIRRQAESVPHEVKLDVKRSLE